MGGGAEEVLDTSTMENWEMGGGIFFGFELLVGYVCMYVCIGWKYRSFTHGDQRDWDAFSDKELKTSGF